MNPACQELEVLRSIYSSGPDALAGAEAATVAAHLEACAECREADRRDRELLGLVKLPAPTPAEARAVSDLAPRTLRELRRRQRRFTWVRRLGAGTGIAAMAAAAMLALLWPRQVHVPAGLGGDPAYAQASSESSQDDGSLAFLEDDLDTDDDASAGSTSPAQIALTAYDAGVGY